MIRFIAIFAGLMVTGIVPAQLAQSPNFRLRDYALDAGGGAAASPGYAAHASLVTPAAGVSSSPSYTAFVGFLRAHPPVPTTDTIIFGVTPSFASHLGGAPITITGVNLSGGTSVMMDGTPVTLITVVSNTQVTATVPAISPGPKDLTVATVTDTDTLARGFIATPGLLASPSVVQGGVLRILNYGPPGDSYLAAISLGTGNQPTPLGPLLLDPSTLALLFPNPVAYTLPEGIHSLALDLPNDPALSNLTVYFQAASLGPTEVVLTNLSSSTMQ